MGNTISKHITRKRALVASIVMLLLAALMFFAISSVHVGNTYAEEIETDQETQAVVNTNAALANDPMPLENTPVAYDVTQGWTQVDTVEWHYDGEHKIMSIRPLGSNDSGYLNATPWMDWDEEILSIEFIKNISIGNAVTFGGCSALQEIKGMGNWDTSARTTMSGMFDNCGALKVIDISNFNTSNVTDMSNMFAGCSAVESLDFGKFDTSRVTNMSNMFGNCSSLKALYLNQFKIDNVRYMNDMFKGCSMLETLYLNFLNTNNLTTMASMFSGCSALKELTFENINTSNVTDMSDLFKGCSVLYNLDLSSFYTPNVRNMSGIFQDCLSLGVLDVSNFDTRYVSSHDGLFTAGNASGFIPLKKITIGKNFTFQPYLPTGYWYDKDNIGYEPKNIPQDKAGVYLKENGSITPGPTPVDPSNPSQPNDPTVPTNPTNPSNVTYVYNGTDVKFNDSLNSTVSGSTNVVLEAKAVDSGDEYDRVTEPVTNQLLGSYSVDLKVNGNAVHDNFGKIAITFPVDASHNGGTATVHHLHAYATSNECVYKYESRLNSGSYYEVQDALSFGLDGHAKSWIQTHVLPAGLSEEEVTDVAKQLQEIHKDTLSTSNINGTNVYLIMNTDGMTKDKYNNVYSVGFNKLEAVSDKPGYITSENVPITDGGATITVEDLSTFAIEITEPGDGSGSGDGNGDGAGSGSNQNGGATQGTGNGTTSGDPSITAAKNSLAQTGDDNATGLLVFPLVLASCGLALIAFGLRKPREE